MTKKTIGYPSGLRQQFGDAVAGHNTTGFRYMIGDLISGGNPVYRAGECLKAITDYSNKELPAEPRIQQGLNHARQHLFHLDGGKRAAILMSPREENPAYRGAPYSVLAGTSLYDPLGRAITKPALEDGINTLSLASNYWFFIEELPRAYNEHFLLDSLETMIANTASNAARMVGMDGSQREEFKTDVVRGRDIAYPTLMEITRWASEKYGFEDNVYERACRKNLDQMTSLVKEDKFPTTIDGELLAPDMMISTAAKIREKDETDKKATFENITLLWRDQFEAGKISEQTLETIYQKIEEVAGFDPRRVFAANLPPTPLH